MDTFGVNVSEFQFLLARQFDASVINCKFSIDENFSFICLMPHDAFIDRLKDLAQMVLRRNKEKDCMMNFEVDQNPRGPHISLMIDTDWKTKYDMILMEETINNFKQVYANVANNLKGMMDLKDNFKDMYHLCFCLIP